MNPVIIELPTSLISQLEDFRKWTYRGLGDYERVDQTERLDKEDMSNLKIDLFHEFLQLYLQAKNETY